MKMSELWDEIHGRSNAHAIIDELEANGRITPELAAEARGILDDIANERCKQMRAPERY